MYTGSQQNEQGNKDSLWWSRCHAAWMFIKKKGQRKQRIMAALERIQGDGIYLRPITMEDTDLIVRWRNSQRVRRNFIYQAEFTKEGHEAWMRNKVATGEVIQFIICLEENSRAVGSVYFRDIDRNDRKAEYGIFIGEADAAGKGIGTQTAKLAVAYARDVMKLHKLILRVFADNTAAVRSYEKAGFVQEAYLKDEHFINGAHRDLLLMAVIFE